MHLKEEIEIQEKKSMNLKEAIEKINNQRIDPFRMTIDDTRIIFGDDREGTYHFLVKINFEHAKTITVEINTLKELKQIVGVAFF